MEESSKRKVMSFVLGKKNILIVIGQKVVEQCTHESIYHFGQCCSIFCLIKFEIIFFLSHSSLLKYYFFSFTVPYLNELFLSFTQFLSDFFFFSFHTVPYLNQLFFPFTQFLTSITHFSLSHASLYNFFFIFIQFLT